MLAIAAVVAALLDATDAPAARCGGERPCDCGDKVVEDYTLPASLGPCPKDGLRIEGRLTFDGGGHVIRGSGSTGTGLRIGTEGSGAKITNLTVTGFEHGIRLIGARDVEISDVEAQGNGDRGPGEGYGIDLSLAASDNTIERARVHHNADEGIHVGTDAARNRIRDSQIFENARENVYFLACKDNRLERSKVYGSGAGHASVYVKFATGTVLEGNTVEDGVIQIRGGARDTLLVGNTLRGGSVVLQEQNDRRFGPGKPSGTTVRGGSITASGACVRIDSASATRIEDVDLDCNEGVRVAAGNRVAVRLPAGAKGKLPVRCVGGGDCFERLPSAASASASAAKAPAARK